MNILNYICSLCNCWLLDHKELLDYKKCVACGYTKKKELHSVGFTTNWEDPESQISKYFKVKEALYLPKFNCLHIPSEEEKSNILKQAEKMDLIRDLFNLPITIHVWIRPILNNKDSEHHGEDYNILVGGATKSSHKIGLACDFHVKDLTCDEVRIKLEPMLEKYNIRMEDNPGSNWVHVDSQQPPLGGRRYFKV